MGVDGIRTQQKLPKQQQAETSTQDARDLLNTIYRVERPKRPSFVMRYSSYVLMMIIVGLILFVLNNREAPNVGTISNNVVQPIEQPSQFGSIDPNAWYAVHLIDGKVYYGRLVQELAGTSLILTNVFYEVPGSSNVQTATTTASIVTTTPVTNNKLVLVKLGTETHRPEDRIVISPDALVFFERLKNDSPVVKAIEDYLER